MKLQNLIASILLASVFFSGLVQADTDIPSEDFDSAPYIEVDPALRKDYLLSYYVKELIGMQVPVSAESAILKKFIYSYVGCAAEEIASWDLLGEDEGIAEFKDWEPDPDWGNRGKAFQEHAFAFAKAAEIVFEQNKQKPLTIYNGMADNYVTLLSSIRESLAQSSKSPQSFGYFLQMIVLCERMYMLVKTTDAEVDSYIVIGDPPTHTF